MLVIAAVVLLLAIAFAALIALVVRSLTEIEMDDDLFGKPKASR